VATANWGLDERVHAGAEHLDPAYVAGYERKAGYDPAADVRVLLDAGIGQGSTVVDMGAGTGVFAMAIAGHVRRVIAVDISPAMLGVLRDRSPAAGNVDVVAAGWVSYDHDSPPADAVFSRNALHQIPDFWKGVALARLAVILRPGGILRLHDLIYDFEPADAPARMERWFAGAVDDATRGWTSEELAEHVRIEHSTYRWLFQPLGPARQARSATSTVPAEPGWKIGQPISVTHRSDCAVSRRPTT
jgi:SAM-dependent methyltransferase